MGEIHSKSLLHLAYKTPKDFHLSLEELFYAGPSLNNLQVSCNSLTIKESGPDFKLVVPRGGFAMHIETQKKIIDNDLAVLKRLGFKIGRVTDPLGIKIYTISLEHEGQLTPLPERLPKKLLEEIVISNFNQPIQSLGGNKKGAETRKRKRNQEKPNLSQQSGADLANFQSMKLAEKYLNFVNEEDESSTDLIWGGTD